MNTIYEIILHNTGSRFKVILYYKHIHNILFLKLVFMYT